LKSAIKNLLVIPVTAVLGKRR